ncbi:transposase [Streptomyces griseoflavus Tu4000]|uniref:Transposase n=1 Tax=Streptomyces griseoflavus Tu4000 TaxID=467200 RepID=D9XJK0_9ACTN|nr:transposase [Streptomyces griseoflavus Tu4000]
MAGLRAERTLTGRDRPGRRRLPQLRDGRAAPQTPASAPAVRRGSRQRPHRKVRTRVEHVIGRMKNYKILRDCRQHSGSLHHAVQAVAHMHNLALAS